MKFRVTGGADGASGISVGSRRYEPGDVIEMTQAKAGWLVDRGLLVADSKWDGVEVEAEELEPEEESELEETDDANDADADYADELEGDDL